MKDIKGTVKCNNLLEKLRKIKIVLTDVDGVLTDGGMYYNEEGLALKKFNVKDGMATHILHLNGYKIGIISTDTNPINKVRAERLKMDYIQIGTWEKLAVAKSISETENLSLENIAFIGDDINDLEILQNVGFSASPNDAIDEIKNIVDYVCANKGGKCAYREYATLIINSKIKE